jgi:hypothetical protein
MGSFEDLSLLNAFVGIVESGSISAGDAVGKSPNRR